jgi:hypothetical protein
VPTGSRSGVTTSHGEPPIRATGQASIPDRSRKRIALILDVGAAVKPYLTPDDPQAALDAIQDHTGSHPVTGGRGPII